MRGMLGLTVLVAAVCGWADALPRPAELQPAVEFWKRVYTEVDADSGLLHDDRYLGVVYERIELPAAGQRARQRAVERAKRRYRAILVELAEGTRQGLDDEARRVLALWREHGGEAGLRGAASRLRFQGGLARRFRAGWIRAGRWLPYIRDALARAGMPAELAALPHVESSFDPGIRSSVGATGMWQFTRSTGRRFMRIDHVVDERLDPFLATDAAVQLLRHDYAVTGSWPLAITAYNHGVTGMRRAAETLGTEDIGVIAARYSSRTFGFASRNFYPALLAAAEVDRDAEKYFGPMRRDAPISSQVIETAGYYRAVELAAALDVPIDVLRELNPALRAPVWRGDKYVPRGFRLRLPADRSEATLRARLAEVTAFDVQRPDRFHTVQWGEALSVIAAQYGVSLRALMDVNDIRNAHRIRAGRVLRLPLPAGRALAAAAPPDPASPQLAEVSFTPDLDAPSPVLPGDLSADPADYSVAGDGSIVIQDGETLGHYAEWLGIRATALRRLNGLRYGRPVVIGQRLKLSFDVVDPATFENRRMRYHRELQEGYFARRHITGTRQHIIRPGDSLWRLARQRYRLPTWLIRQYNPDIDFDHLRGGERVVIPVIALNR